MLMLYVVCPDCCCAGRIRDHGLFSGPVSYYPGVTMDAQDTSAVDAATVAALAADADVIVACVGEGTYAEKPGDIDDLALPQVRYFPRHAPTSI